MLPTDDKERKDIKLTSQWKLFPLATIALNEHIKTGADKYCDGIIKWDRSKSPEELESLLRHAFEQVQNPTCVETAKAIAWRGMANLEKVLEAGSATPDGPDQRDITEANLPVDLAEFLRSEGCLDEFVVELAGKALPRNGCDWIATAFTWKDAPSGMDFWSEVDNRWLDHLNAMNKEEA